eukprot:6200211-Pleurochrysis_carterae.AAC.5
MLLTCSSFPPSGIVAAHDHVEVASASQFFAKGAEHAPTYDVGNAKQELLEIKALLAVFSPSVELPLTDGSSLNRDNDDGAAGERVCASHSVPAGAFPDTAHSDGATHVRNAARLSADDTAAPSGPADVAIAICGDDSASQHLSQAALHFSRARALCDEAASASDAAERSDQMQSWLGCVAAALASVDQGRHHLVLGVPGTYASSFETLPFESVFAIAARGAWRV